MAFEHFSIGERVFDFSKEIALMGVLNLTPDSFSDGGDWNDPEIALSRALQLEEEGADLLDVGAESTRPYAPEVNLEEEKQRLFPALEKILSRVKIPISIDTRKASIAKEAIRLGVSLLNDVSAFSFDSEMMGLMLKQKIPFVLMHQRGTPQTMMENTNYANVLSELKHYFENKINLLKERGVAQERIILDPGLGFAKKGKQNLKILANLNQFSHFKCPILIGLSRKSFLQDYLAEKEHPRQRDLISAIANLLSVEHGAHILRVHDVKKTKNILSFLKDFQEMKEST